MTTPEKAEKKRLANLQAMIDKFEAQIDHKLSNNHDHKWPIFVSQAEDHLTEVVVGAAERYVKHGWTCWYKPGGFLYLAPKAAKIDDTQWPNTSMGTRYE